jgi:hypothetical protein
MMARSGEQHDEGLPRLETNRETSRPAKHQAYRPVFGGTTADVGRD